MDYRIIELQQRVAELDRFQRETTYLRDQAKAERDLRLLTGESPGMKAVRLAIQQVARTDSTVLILGETGQERNWLPGRFTNSARGETACWFP